MLGKRKRDTKVVSRPLHTVETSTSATVETSNSIQNIFRRHFESAFEPLPEQPTTAEADKNDDPEESSDTHYDISEWSGLSETQAQPTVVEVVNHAVMEEDGDAEFHRARQKAYMSSRPPREVDSRAITHSAKESKPSEEDNLNEKINLKHDLDLQRLLRESHLLERSRSTAATPGRERQMAVDMRVQALGAKESIYTQQNMPRSHRIGITKKSESREARRRREAKENGVVLEKVAGPKKKGAAGMESKRRVRGVDAPGIGKFSGGTLKLSRSDVASIQGTTRMRSGGTNSKRRGRTT